MIFRFYFVYCPYILRIKHVQRYADSTSCDFLHVTFIEKSEIKIKSKLNHLFQATRHVEIEKQKHTLKNKGTKLEQVLIPKCSTS